MRPIRMGKRHWFAVKNNRVADEGAHGSRREDQEWREPLKMATPEVRMLLLSGTSNALNIAIKQRDLAKLEKLLAEGRCDGIRLRAARRSTSLHSTR